MAKRERLIISGTSFNLNRHNKNHEKVLVARKQLRASTAPEIQDEARKGGVAAVRCLRSIVQSKIASDVARISAAQTLLDRGYGKPTQTNVNASVNTDGKPTEITQQELDRRITETITRIEGLTRRKREKITSTEQPADLRKLH